MIAGCVNLLKHDIIKYCVLSDVKINNIFEFGKDENYPHQRVKAFEIKDDNLIIQYLKRES